MTQIEHKIEIQFFRTKVTSFFAQNEKKDQKTPLIRTKETFYSFSTLEPYGNKKLLPITQR